MSSISLRFGIGIGDVSTEINYEYSYEIDGSAYHRARAMIKKLEINKSQYLIRKANIFISSQDNNCSIDKLLNSQLSLCPVLKAKWTSRQAEIIQAYLLNEENQYKTAEN